MADDEQPLLNDWRQGDLALAPIELPILIDDAGDMAIAFVQAIHGVAVLTQSCDIVRAVAVKPTVQVAALALVDPDEMARVRSRAVPSRAYLEPLEGLGLVVDLDSVAIVEKAVVARWTRTPGCATDDDQRLFGAALARHRQRFAFPDEFNDLVKPVRRWIESKRTADSPNGRMIREIREIRVITDDWENPDSLVFLLIFSSMPDDAELKQWEAAVRTLEAKGRMEGFPKPEFRLATYDDLSAAEYVNSDRLDWDGLSEA